MIFKDKRTVLEDQMEKIKVPFKFYDVPNELAGETETKWTKLNGIFWWQIKHLIYHEFHNINVIFFPLSKLGKDLKKVIADLDIHRLTIAMIDASDIVELWNVSTSVIIN